MNVKQKLSMILAVIMAASLFAACGGSSQPSAPQASAAPPSQSPVSQSASSEKPAEPVTVPEPVTLVTTTSQLTGASTQRLQVNMTKYAEQMGGLFNFNHYDSSSLFKSSAEFNAVSNGDVDIGFLQAAFFYDNGAEWINMLDTGFLYNSYEHMKAVFDPGSEIGAWLQQKIWEEFHIWTVGGFFLGTRNVWLRDGSKIVNTPEDLKGVKMRMPNSASFLMLGAALGASPTPLDGNEVYLAMQTGTIDAQENIMLQSYAQAQYEVCKSIVMTKHMLTPNFIAINGDRWESLTPEQQEHLTKLITDAAIANDKEVMGEEERILKDCVEKHGMTIQEPDREAFRDHVLEYYLADKGNQANWDQDKFNEILEMGEQYK